MKKHTCALMFVLAGLGMQAQTLPIYDQFFFNPTVYNPSYIGHTGYKELYVSHRQQWVGLEGAPVTTNINFQLPVSEKIAFGAVFSSDERGVVSTFEGNLGLSYTVGISSNSKLALGLVGGLGRNTIDSPIDDRALGDSFDNSLFLVGQFGLNFTYKDLNIGFSAPRLFENNFFDENGFELEGLEAIRATISQASYRFDLNHKISFEPHIIYLMDDLGTDQFGGLGVFYYEDLLWIGGGYRQEVGANAFLGMNINNSIRIGYAYEFAPEVVEGFGQGSHEFQIGIRFGKKRSKTVAKDEGVTGEDMVLDTTEPGTTTKEELPGQNNEPPVILAEEQKREITQQEEQKSEVIEEEQEREVVQEEDEVEEPIMPVAQQDTEEDTRLEKYENVVEINEEAPGTQLARGFYVVVGAFRSVVNAEKFRKSITALGYEGSMAYSQSKNLHYVYVFYAQDYAGADAKRDAIRKINVLSFPDAWILRIN